jgi:hypothetical protein
MLTCADSFILFCNNPRLNQQYLRSVFTKLLHMKRLVVIAFTLIALASCDVLQQAQQMATLAKCDFRIRTVENTSLAGVNVQRIQHLSDVNLMDAARLTAAYAGKSFPLTFTLNVEARNPNAGTASMQRLDWILYIDNIEMASGTNTQPITIPGNQGTAIIPLQISTDLKKSLSGKSGDAILNFGFNLAGAGNTPSRITLKAKPTITISGFQVSYPGYISVSQEFSSK